MMQSTDTIKEYSSKEEISLALGQYNLVVKVFGQIIDRIAERNLGDTRWFIFSEKIGKKYLTQAYTLQHIFADDHYPCKRRNAATLY